jgi:hypothetical protein
MTSTFNDRWEISNFSTAQKNIDYLLLDSQGKVIVSEKWLLENTTNRLIIPNNALPSGTYFLAFPNSKTKAIKLSKI